MAFQMVYCDQRLLQSKCYCLGVADADQERAREPRPLRNCESIDGLITPARIGQCFAHDRNHGFQMFARGEFWHNSAIRLVRGYLRENDVSENLLSRADDSRSRFITGAL